jgi:hypothetical protein
MGKGGAYEQDREAVCKRFSHPYSRGGFNDRGIIPYRPGRVNRERGVTNCRHLKKVLQKASRRIKGKTGRRHSLASIPAPFAPACANTLSSGNNGKPQRSLSYMAVMLNMKDARSIFPSTPRSIYLVFPVQSRYCIFFIQRTSLAFLLLSTLLQITI